MEIQSFSQGYYHVTLCNRTNSSLLRSNTERAFILAQLQDLLSPRLFIGDVPAHKQLASCIDLLAFSITPSSVQLVVYAIDRSVLRYMCARVTDRFMQYQSETHINDIRYLPLEISASFKKLRGPHHALAKSITLHLRHEDWEYDRYSSIGFYLHDRRGDWMRTWRVAKLYENTPAHYYQLAARELHATRSNNPTSLPALAP